MDNVMCESCGKDFKVKGHDREYPDKDRVFIVAGSGVNTVYHGQQNEEYMICPHCMSVDTDNPLVPANQNVP